MNTNIQDFISKMKATLPITATTREVHKFLHLMITPVERTCVASGHCPFWPSSVLAIKEKATIRFGNGKAFEISKSRLMNSLSDVHFYNNLDVVKVSSNVYRFGCKWATNIIIRCDNTKKSICLLPQQKFEQNVDFRAEIPSRNFTVIATRKGHESVNDLAGRGSVNHLPQVCIVRDAEIVNNTGASAEMRTAWRLLQNVLEYECKSDLFFAISEHGKAMNEYIELLRKAELVDQTRSTNTELKSVNTTVNLLIKNDLVKMSIREWFANATGPRIVVDLADLISTYVGEHPDTSEVVHRFIGREEDIPERVFSLPCHFQPLTAESLSIVYAEYFPLLVGAENLFEANRVAWRMFAQIEDKSFLVPQHGLKFQTMQFGPYRWELCGVSGNEQCEEAKLKKRRM